MSKSAKVDLATLLLFIDSSRASEFNLTSDYAQLFSPDFYKNRRIKWLFQKNLMLSGSSFELSTGARVNFSRPSIDVLFESMVLNYAERSIGIILTEANHDGARGLQEIQKAGGFTIVQDPETAESQAMPLAAMASCSVDRLLRLGEIGPFLASLQPTKISRRAENYGSI